MQIGTINVLVSKCSTLEKATTTANQQYLEQLQAAMEGKSTFTVSMSHDTGLTPGHGYHCSIIATVIYS
jgi:hypothetical protein